MHGPATRVWRAGVTAPPQPALARAHRTRRGVACAASPTPWRFDDLAAPPAAAPHGSSGSIGELSDLDALWRQKVQGMQRAQSEVAEMQRQMDQRFAAAQREMQQAPGAAAERQQQLVGADGAPCGYSWQRSERLEGAGGTYRAWRSESLTVIGVPPPRCAGLAAYEAAAVPHVGPLAGPGLLLAAAVAGFWAAATAAFSRRLHRTVYSERSHWWLLLAWPLLLLVSDEFRQQWAAAMRGAGSGGGGCGGGDGGSGGDTFVPS